MTSFDVVARVRRERGIRRVGHAGTLDPMATGVLLVCLGEATKIVRYLMDTEKTYRAVALFGVETNTQDADGEVTRERDASAVTAPQVRAALTAFVGRVLQKPPMYSAIRKDGQRLYELARKGVEVERQRREIEVHEAALEEMTGASATLRIRCSKGTYIRTLAADLGEKLGVGAHLTALRRTRVGPFDVESAVQLDAVANATPILAGRALSFLPAARVDAEAAERIRSGGRPPPDLEQPDGESFCIVAPGDDLVALASKGEGGKTKLLRVLHGAS